LSELLEEENKIESLGDKEDKNADEKVILTNFEKFANLFIKYIGI